MQKARHGFNKGGTCYDNEMYGVWRKESCKNKNMIYLKINKTEQNEIIALCDSNLIGKSFSEKDLNLDVNERFYKGDVLDEDKIVKILMNARNINIVGEEAMRLAVKHNIVEKENIIKIKNIPHSIIFEI